MPWLVAPGGFCMSVGCSTTKPSLFPPGNDELSVSHWGRSCPCRLCRAKAGFDMAAAWEGRCRKWYGDRYDFRHNLVSEKEAYRLNRRLHIENHAVYSSSSGAVHAWQMHMQG